MAYPTYSIQDLSDFSGRPTSEYTDYATTSALPQATLLFKIGTCLADFPEDPIGSELAKMAILAMADAIILAQPYQAVVSNPFNSETIGSYSYSKVAGAVSAGLPTGIAWFDLAVQRLSVCDPGVISSGGIEVFEHDGIFVEGELPGNVRLLGPKDLLGFDPWLHDPTQRPIYPE